MIVGRAFGALKKPWKELEPLVTSIEQTYTEVQEIMQFRGHFTGEANLAISRTNLAVGQGLDRPSELTLAKINHLIELLEGDAIKFSKPADIKQISDLFRQRIEAKLDQPSMDTCQVTDIADPGSKILYLTNYHTPMLSLIGVTLTIGEDMPSITPLDIDKQLAEWFTDLKGFDEAYALQQRVVEQLPEMRPHRSTKRNVLKVDKIMTWIESTTSQMLWIDGNNILQRQDCNATISIPLILLGESHCEIHLILRHFCGDSHSIKRSNYRTLIQALLRQLFKQHPDVWKKSSQLTKTRINDIHQLWISFVECLKEVQAQCTFILIDSIDFLEAEITQGVEMKGKLFLES
jgi:hypothetical protein